VFVPLVAGMAFYPLDLCPWMGLGKLVEAADEIEVGDGLALWTTRPPLTLPARGPEVDGVRAEGAVGIDGNFFFRAKAFHGLNQRRQLHAIIRSLGRQAGGLLDNRPVHDFHDAPAAGAGIPLARAIGEDSRLGPRTRNPRFPG